MVSFRAKLADQLTRASTMDSTRAHIGICSDVVFTSMTVGMSYAGAVHRSSPAAPKLIARRPIYQDAGTGR